MDGKQGGTRLLRGVWSVVGPGEDVDGDADDEERRAWASAMTPSARWRDCWRMEVLDCSVAWKEFSAAISDLRVLMAACKD